MRFARSLLHVTLAVLAAAIPVSALTATADVGGINGSSKVDLITWIDSKGLTREVFLAREAPAGSSMKDFITRFTYQTNSSAARTFNDSEVENNLSGICLTLNCGNGRPAWTNLRSTGANFIQRARLPGGHHFIYRITFDQPGTASAGFRRAGPVTIDWVFMDGLDHFLYSITRGGIPPAEQLNASWTVAIVPGRKSDSACIRLLDETGEIQNGKIVFTAIQGAVVESGRSGSGDTAVVKYRPPGFNPVYRCWEFMPDTANVARFNFDVGSGSYQTPVFVLENFTAATIPTAVSINGRGLGAGTGYYASLDPANHRLWISLLGEMRGKNLIGINSYNTKAGGSTPLR
jgi:hypothetical protein